MPETSELEVLYAALHSPLGVVLYVSDLQLAINRLYSARKKANDPKLGQLQLRPQGPQELWIVKALLKDDIKDRHPKDQDQDLSPKDLSPDESQA